MSVLDLKLARELKAASGLLLAITSIIAVGVASFVSMLSAYRNLSGAKDRYYAECRMADFWIDVKKAPLPELAPIADLPGVTDTRSRIQFSATVDLEDVLAPINALVLSAPDEPKKTINDLLLRRGSYFTNRRDNEVIVNEAFAKHHDVRPGTYIHLILNNRRQELFVVGTAISSEFVYLLGPGALTPDPEHFGVFYLKRSYAEDVFDFDGAANQLVGRLAPDVGPRRKEIFQQAESILAPYGVFTTIALKDQPSNMYLSNEIEGLSAFGVLMPMIFLAVAAVVLHVLMTRLTEQQRVVVGTFKAMGYRDARIFTHFIKFGVVVGIVGGALGTALGYWFAESMTGLYQQFFEFPSLNNHFYFDIAAGGMLISVLFAVMGTLHGARQVLKLQPAESMRPKPPARGGAILLERIVWLWRHLSFGWRMVLRNVWRNRLRTAAGLFAAAMGASLLVSGFMSMHSTFYLVDFQFEKVWRSDLDLRFRDERGWDGLLEAKRLPGVDYAEPVLDVSCTFVNGPHRRRGGITGVIPDARLTQPRDIDGRPLRITQEGVTMSQALADLLHLSRGDWVTVEPIKGLREPRQVQVVEIADSYLGLTAHANIEYLSRLVGEEYALTGTQLEIDQSEDQRRDLYHELKRLPALEAVNSRSDMIKNLTDTILQNMWVFIGLLVLFAGIVFFGSIVNASLISLAERQREVATLRVLGYDEWQIGGLFLRESMLVNLLGTLLGLPLGYALMIAMAVWYNNELIRLPVVCPPSVWWWTLSLAVVFGLLAHGFVQWSIQRMNWLAALQVKE